MIVLSLNVRGVGGAPKFLALKRLIELVKTDVFLVQETMVCSFRAMEVFSKLLFQWKLCAVDSNGLSGDLLLAWNPNKANFDDFFTPAGILLEGFVKDVNRSLKMVNCYGPYSNRQVFSDDLKNDGILNEQGLILGGDLNFTQFAREIWGSSRRLDPMASYLNQQLQDVGLIDVEPVEFLPTWRNGRVFQENVAKRLDRFLIDERPADAEFRYRSWVVNVKTYDHMLVVFQIDKGQERIKYPFKLNSVWLSDPDFEQLVRSNWNQFQVRDDSSPMESLVHKLKLLKSLVILWERNKKFKSKEDLVQLELDLESLYSSHPGGFERDDDRKLVMEKETRKMGLLKKEEKETWRQKSRATWLACGDRNTKFFHSFANFRRQINSV
jgi:hypothetical protein